ncbi:hepatocyte growth factor receptor-like [Saccostrea cucullata]|uniref:hepatocyte growth factor receptor-like n=1 Tax=Saccostrea cuccullata TaxID=36930 RepID=UPI002ED06D87
MTLNEENAAHPYIQLVSDITGSALGKLVNITVHDVSGVRYSKELLLFAKTPMELPKSVPKLNRSVLFSVGSNLQGKYFNNFLTENDIFDLFLKPTYISSMDYRSMFENDDFVFLLFNQNSKAKLAKLCKSIDKYNPKRVYEDIPIYCKDGNKTFDVIVDGKFINASGDRYLTAIFTNFAAGSSALCMFSEFEIYDAFLKSRRDRYGCPYHDLPNNELIFDDSQNLPKCVYLLLSESELFSGISDAFKKQCFCNNVTNMVPQFGIVIGILPLFGKSVYGTQNVITVIGDQIVDEFTLLYLGTHEGSVIKLLVNKTFSVHYIETIRIDKSEIRAIIDINEDPVILTENKLSYSKEEPTKDFHVLFKYGLNIPSRNLESFGNKTFISAYKCEYLSPDKRDCSRCKYLNVVEGFNCVWCGKLYGCVESEICTDNPTCSPPEIDKIEPTDGPIGGGTFIKIEGRNLGASLAEVTNVTVAGVKCSNLHFVQTSLQCTTGKSNGPLSGDVMVLVSGHWSNRTVKFQYKTPEITGIYPESIIKSGVRIIRIAGQNINIGNRKYQVILSPLNSSEQNKTCAIDMDQSTDDGEIFCIPEKSDVLGEHVVQVVFDSKTITKLKDKFLTYLSNPYINGTTPPSTNMKSIMSGGLGFLVQGQGFVDVIENILISLSESSIEGPKCSRQSSVLLYCKFPQMQQEGQQTRKKRDIVYQTIVIHIDGFKFVISRTVIYVSDPVIFELNGNRSFNYDPSSENRNIYVKGDQLNTITDIKDYFVHVGSGECVILELFSDTLKCLPPYKEPSPRLSEDKLYIRVRVGNINTIIGVVQYPLRGTATSVSNNTLYTILASLAFLIVIACVAFILIRQRKQDKVKTTKRTRVSMENIQGDSARLNEDQHAVVADFGLSRDIYEKDYYSSSNKKTRLPVKWMAPESLEKGIYSSQSDVWSFGVTMWELLTRGSKPYPEVDGWDMLKYLKNSRRLPKPTKCPDILYNKMLRCWNLDPDERPSFSDLVIELSEIVSSTDEKFETHSDYQSLQNTYINTGIEDYLQLEN